MLILRFFLLQGLGFTAFGLGLFSIFLWLVESVAFGGCIGWTEGGSSFAGEFGLLFGVRAWKQCVS